jgi:Na+/melibiose symporter-like transporter
MCVRLNSNIFGTFLPFYLINVLKIEPNADENTTVPFSVALVPLIIYFSSSIVSPKLTVLYSKIGRGKTLLFGALLEGISLIILYFLTYESKDYIYVLAILIGFSQTMVLSTGINLISDVIGSKGDSGAFVFGIYSFLDKISAGIVIFTVANLSCFTYG